ncbi:MAG: thiamine/thiamine pyrophosphate ABC transporter permease ThiP, partial [Actinobacillus minor]|nr:thiamine/thiamine pyrophosphate ABC transporter permease ThiP [Actinobacillus minor]
MSKFSPTAFLTKQAAWLIYFSLIGLYAFSLWALVQHQQAESFFSWQEMGHILAYSSSQALLSALISTGLGILLAKAFFYIDFKGKALLYNAIQFVWALPSLVIIFAVIGIWGNSGWLAQLWQAFSFSWQFNVYGL